MDEASLEGALNDLLRHFGETTDPSHQKLADLAKQADASRKQLQKSISTLQELLDYLRVCIKYQAFDLEATRRENTYLRKLLEDNGSGGENKTTNPGAAPAGPMRPQQDSPVHTMVSAPTRLARESHHIRGICSPASGRNLRSMMFTTASKSCVRSRKVLRRFCDTVSDYLGRPLRNNLEPVSIYLGHKAAPYCICYFARRQGI
jgi:hypothetical protein